MRRTLVLLFVIAATACDGASQVAPQTVKVTIDPHEKSVRPAAPKKCWVVISAKPPGGWNSATIGRDESVKNPHVEIRCSDAPGRGVKVEVAFNGPFDPHMASLTFHHTTKVDEVKETSAEGGAEERYQGWAMSGEDFILHAPKSARKITFLAWPHVH